MKTETIKWERFCGFKLNDKEIMKLLKDMEYYYRFGTKRMTTGDILIEATPLGNDIGIEVYRRIKCGTCKK